MRVGLTGGIGSGKSEVAKILENLGAYIIDTDLLAREAVKPNSQAWTAIAEEWPWVMVGGTLDRGTLAEIIFKDERARARLNDIVHPFVRKLAAEQETFAQPGRLVVHVVPLLFETGYANQMDKNILVIAPEDVRVARAAARDGVSEGAIRIRMAAQIDPEAARAKADYVIENDGDLKLLRKRVQAVYNQLQ